MTFTPMAAQADLTPAGVYVEVECQVAEEIAFSSDGHLTGLRTKVIGEDGEVLPAGPIEGYRIDVHAWPTVTFTCMIDANSIPDTMNFQLLNLVNGQYETVLDVELKKD